MHQPQVLDPWKLQTYALQWRSLARQWTRLARNESTDRAVQLRRSAQRALYAAFEIDRFLGKAHLPGAPPASSRKTP